ncbi:MAG TPA: hypothetical protein VM915_04695 [Verrucomicrobiae bacterium]|nr:hypothetical protein [Verrucomicrobiae bacterium]
MKPFKLAAAAFALAGLSACVTVTPPIGSTFRAPSDSVSILIMDPDVEVTFVTTGGADVRADWSQQAEANLVQALQTELSQTGERATIYDVNLHGSPDSEQALLLNEAVTDALAAHVVFMDIATFAGPLPHVTAESRETYTLGESVRALAPGAEADYALFMTSRSQIESSGLFMAKVLIGAATGYVPATANFRGTYVSLVDLRTGEVVWLRGWNMGDPRNPDEAASIMNEIFTNGPLAPPPAS